MNERPAGVSFAPRSVAGCLDLAVMYVGRQLPLMLRLWLCAAAPSCALVYVLSYFYEFDLRMTIVVIYFATAVLGTWLIAGVTPAAFANLTGGAEPSDEAEPPLRVSPEVLDVLAVVLAALCVGMILAGHRLPLAIGDEMALLAALALWVVLFARAVLLLWDRGEGRIRIGRPLTVVLLMRTLIGVVPLLCLISGNGWLIFLGIVITFVLAAWPAVRYGFLAEKTALTQFDVRLHHRGTDRLLNGELGDLIVRGCGIVLFFGTLWCVMLLTADVLSSLLFQTPIFIGRLGDIGDSERLWAFLLGDPLLLTTLTATALLVYPISRLAWFLCYIDVRVRKDCWDLELGLSREAARLRERA